MNSQYFTFLLFFSFSLAFAKLVITPEERKALDKFRPLVKDLLTHEYQNTDSYLIRWLKAKKLNVGDAVKFLKEAQQWRKENNVDTILNEKFPFPIYYSTDGVDYEGRVVFTSNIGDLDIRKIVLSGQTEAFIRYTLYETEKAVSKSSIKVYKSNGTFTDSRLVSIADLHGFNLRTHACLACVDYFTKSTRIYERIYPGIAGLEVAINTPRIALPLINFLLSIVSDETREAFKVFGTDRAEWSEYLKKVIPEDQRTLQFGGTKPNKIH